MIAVVALLMSLPALAQSPAHSKPAPLLRQGHPVDWWFVFKLNAKVFPECGGVERACPFGGTVKTKKYPFSEQFVFSSSEHPALQQGKGCAGDDPDDPLGATFDQVYHGAFHYLIWNDQFYKDPPMKGCGNSCNSPWGHSKGMLAWNDQGDGFVLQVSTPSWPAAGSAATPRKTDGNTLGCIKDDNVKVSQHFFALKLTKDDLVKVLEGLGNASVVTDPAKKQIVNNGGPEDVQKLVTGLGVRTKVTTVIHEKLSSGVELISKPSALQVPPWQMVSAVLGGPSLRAATWWASPQIFSTTASTKIGCWDKSLGEPGAVEIATSGTWDGKAIGLKGGPGPDFNHAKIGVSTSGTHHLAIFGDLNQQGTISGSKCGSSQNGRGGMFFVVDNTALHASVESLITGDSAPTRAPKVKAAKAKTAKPKPAKK